MAKPVHGCQYAACREAKAHAERQRHHQMNVFLSRLDEQRRRCYVALESKRIGHDVDTLLSHISGMNVETIRGGRHEIDDDLQSRPTARVRVAGGGRPAIEKRDEAEAWLVELLKDEMADGPLSEQKWQRSSLRKLEDRLAAQVGNTSHC